MHPGQSSNENSHVKLNHLDVKHHENPYLLLLLHVLKTIRSPEDGHTKSCGSLLKLVMQDF